MAALNQIEQVGTIVENPVQLAKYYFARDSDVSEKSISGTPAEGLRVNTSAVETTKGGKWIDGSSVADTFVDDSLIGELVDWDSFKMYAETSDVSLDMVDTSYDALKVENNEAKRNRLRVEFWDQRMLDAEQGIQQKGASKPCATVEHYGEPVLNKRGEIKRNRKDKVRCDFCGAVYCRTSGTVHRRSKKHIRAKQYIERMIQSQALMKGKKFFLVPENTESLEDELEERLLKRLKARLLQDKEIIMSFK